VVKVQPDCPRESLSGRPPRRPLIAILLVTPYVAHTGLIARQEEHSFPAGRDVGRQQIRPVSAILRRVPGFQVFPGASVPAFAVGTISFDRILGEIQGFGAGESAVLADGIFLAAAEVLEAQDVVMRGHDAAFRKSWTTLLSRRTGGRGRACSGRRRATAAPTYRAHRPGRPARATTD